MIDVKLIREKPELVKRGLANRGGRSLPTFEQVLRLDIERLSLQKEVEDLRARRNRAADEIGRRKKQNEDVATPLSEMESLKKDFKRKEESLRSLEERVSAHLLEIPNLPLESVPLGKGPAENKSLREIGKIPQSDFEPKDHTTLGEYLGILDFEAARALSGSRFALLKGAGARLERALFTYMLDVHTKEHGYTEIYPPFLVNQQSMIGTGQLPKFADELYKCAEDDLYLIPTAEVPLTGLLKGRLVDENQLPIRYCAYTACFRREAGSYGKDTRGLIRNHQFNKVELVSFSRPEVAEKELETLTSHAEEILKRLGIPYRVIALCTGDIGFSAAKTYDLEVWMPSEKMWREISSCSVFTDFQARRIGLKYRTADGKRQHLYTLNGSGVAVGRAFAAILENFQTAEGHVQIPAALVPYFGDKIIKRI